MKIKKLLPYIFIPTLLTFSFAFLCQEQKVMVEVSAANNTETDMSNIALLDGESFDTSNIIYDDFSGTYLDNNWVVSHRKWGGYDNKGVSADNVFLDTENHKVIIRALGNQHIENSTVAGVGGPVSGGAIILKNAARPGRYETKLKVAYRVGVCNAMWTYTENSQGENHEIDIEFPFRDNRGNNSFDEIIFTNYIGESNFEQTHRTLDYYLNDGEYHTFAFDWYYSANHKVVNYYIDSVLLASHHLSSKLPFLPSRLWLGCWVPNNPYFVGLPDFDQCFMEIDYFKYSPFANQEDVTKGNAGGAGNTSTNYRIINHGFDKYDWMGNGSFNAIAKNQSLEDRGFEVEGNVLLNNAFDHQSLGSSGGLKMAQNASIIQKIDSTYPGYKYKLSTYYKGAGRASILFYNKDNNMFHGLPLTMPNKTEWGIISYNYEVPAETFYTKIKFESNDSELYLDDISVIFAKDEPIEEVVLVSITIEGPAKTTYKIGETLDLTGLVVTAHYSDGTSQVITDYKVSEVDLSTAGNKLVIISYKEQTAAFLITVDEEGHSSVSLKSITLEGNYKTEYNVGEELDLTGLIVRGQYSDGSTKVITNYKVSSVDMSTAGTKRVTITYINKMAYYEITVNKPAEKQSSMIGCGGYIAASSAVIFISSLMGIVYFVRKRKD